MTVEFSRIINVQRVLKKNKPLDFVATLDERTSLAERLLIESITSFSVDYVLQSTHDPKLFYLKGHLKAQVVQKCIVTEAPVNEKIDDQFDVVLRDEKRPDEDSFDIEEPIDDVDYIENGEIDLGEIATQYLILNLNPYPKSEEASKSSAFNEKKPNPFAVLEKLKK